MQKDMRMYRRPWTSWPSTFLVCRADSIYSGYLELDGRRSDRREATPQHGLWEDDLFSTAVMRAKLMMGPRWSSRSRFASSISWIGFHYYLANQLVENVQKLRQQDTRHIRCTADGARLWDCHFGEVALTRRRGRHQQILADQQAVRSNSRPIIKMASTKISAGCL